jgi:hypothetical protein
MMNGAIPPLLNTPSRRGFQLKNRHEAKWFAKVNDILCLVHGGVAHFRLTVYFCFFGGGGCSLHTVFAAGDPSAGWHRSDALPQSQHHALFPCLDYSSVIYIHRRMHSAYLCFVLRVLADCVCARACVRSFLLSCSIELTPHPILLCMFSRNPLC